MYGRWDGGEREREEMEEGEEEERGGERSETHGDGVYREREGLI